MKITVEESPYGDTGVVYDGMLGMLQHFRLQLLSFKSQSRTPEQTLALDADIAGYEEVINSKSQKNAELFAKTKRDPVTHEDRFSNNLDLVNYLKATGQWETLP